MEYVNNILIISLIQQSKMSNGYSKASSEFAKGNPQKLLSSSNLLYRLKEFAGVEAKSRQVIIGKAHKRMHSQENI